MLLNGVPDSSNLGMGDHVFARGNGYGDSSLMMIKMHASGEGIDIELINKFGDIDTNTNAILSEHDIERLMGVLEEHLDTIRQNKKASDTLDVLDPHQIARAA